MKKNGKYLITAWGVMHSVLMLWTSLVGSKKVISAMSIEKTEQLILIKKLIEAEKIKLVIDRRYKLEQIAKAHDYIEKGHKRGNILISVT
jgi:NADPH:quinone reductase-like Zn-dependent oxidoreductase